MRSLGEVVLDITPKFHLPHRQYLTWLSDSLFKGRYEASQNAHRKVMSLGIEEINIGGPEPQCVRMRTHQRSPVQQAGQESQVEEHTGLEHEH